MELMRSPRAWRRRMGSALLGAGALVLALAVGAAADSPDPVTIDVEQDGATVTLSGTWEWLSKDDPCGPGTRDNRAAGWAVDWDEGFTGNIVPSKGNSVLKYHMGSATDNRVSVSEENDGLGDCGWSLGDSGVEGTWGPISYTYTEPGTYDICVLMYDVRYTMKNGVPVLRDTKQLTAGGSSRNTDNSAETNYYSAGNQCAEATIEIGEPELSLEKTALTESYAAPDDVIDYEFTVENIGAMPVAGPVTIDDDLTTDEECPAVDTVGDEDTDLDPGESIVCTATYTVTQDDIDHGQVDNTAIASADGYDSNESSATVYADQTFELTLTKTSLQDTFLEAGDVIDYEFEVENTGNVTLAGPVTIDDDLTDDEACPDLVDIGDEDADLDPGEIVTCTATYTITEDDVLAEEVTNTAFASADGTDSNDDSVTVYSDREILITLEKSAIQEDYDAPDDVIDYEFLVTNEGNVRLPGPVTIDDDLTDDESCPALTGVGNNDTYLDVDESVTCTASYTVTQDDIDVGEVTNTAIATVDGNDSDESSVTVTADQLFELTLVKTAKEDAFREAGDILNYEFEVENTGNVTLAGPVEIDDDITDDESCPELTGIGDNDTDFDPGETVTCTASYTVTTDDVDAGSVTNTAFASADGVDSNEDSVTVDSDRETSLKLVKRALQSEWAQRAGEIIEYEFDVTNTGNIRLEGPVEIDDDRTDDEMCPDLTEIGNNDEFLDLDETLTCTATYETTEDDVIAGAVFNTAFAFIGDLESNEDSVRVKMAPTVLAILDASGSIQSRTVQTIRNYNEFLAKWQSRTQLAPYTFVLFSTVRYNERYAGRPIGTVPRLTQSTFSPVGRSPIYDSVARAIKDLEASQPKGQVHVIIATDGADNASVDWTKRQLARLIARMESENDWSFTYEGARLAALERAVAAARR